MLLVDRCCRRPFIALEPNFAVLFELCKNIEGYRPRDAEYRRVTAAKASVRAVATWPIICVRNQ